MHSVLKFSVISIPYSTWVWFKRVQVSKEMSANQWRTSCWLCLSLISYYWHLDPSSLGDSVNIPTPFLSVVSLCCRWLVGGAAVECFHWQHRDQCSQPIKWWLLLTFSSSFTHQAGGDAFYSLFFVFCFFLQLPQLAHFLLYHAHPPQLILTLLEFCIYVHSTFINCFVIMWMAIFQFCHDAKRHVVTIIWCLSVSR